MSLFDSNFFMIYDRIFISVELFLFILLFIKVLVFSCIALKKAQIVSNLFYFYVIFIILQILNSSFILINSVIKPIDYTKGISVLGLLGESKNYIRNIIFVESFLFLNFYCVSVEDKLSVDRSTYNLISNKKADDFRSKVAYITFLLFVLLQSLFVVLYPFLIESIYFDSDVMLIAFIVLILFNIQIQILCGAVSKPKHLILWRNYVFCTLTLVIINTYLSAISIRLAEDVSILTFQTIITSVIKLLQLLTLVRISINLQDVRSLVYVNRDF